jgi:hypothetical protein
MTVKTGFSLAAAAAVSVIALAGCGGGGSTTAAAGATTPASQSASAGTSSSSAAAAPTPSQQSSPATQTSPLPKSAASLLAQPTVPADSSSTSFTTPALTGVKGWGTYTRIGERVKVYICVEDLNKTAYGVGAEAIGTDGTQTNNIGTVLFPHLYGKTQCTTSVLMWGAHLSVHAFIGGDDGTVVQTGSAETLY